MGRFYVEGEYPTTASGTSSAYRVPNRRRNARELVEKTPLYVVGRRCAVGAGGAKWLTWRNPNRDALRNRYPSNLYSARPRTTNGMSSFNSDRVTAERRKRMGNKLLHLGIYAAKGGAPLLTSRASITELQAASSIYDSHLPYPIPLGNTVSADSILELMYSMGGANRIENTIRP